ncbi:MAG: amino acid racemase, partial [Caldilineae bacterium]
MKTIGILGGMGPAATVDLFDRIVRATPARRDQDHIPILIVNDPSVPDRSGAILHGGPDPRPVMAAGIAKLAQIGADFIVIPCNTAHHYLPDLQTASPIPILDMIQETVQAVLRQAPHTQRKYHGENLAVFSPEETVDEFPPGSTRARRVGILATSGTLAVGLYQRALEAEGLEPVEPDAEVLELIMAGIYGPQGVKAGGSLDEAHRLFVQAGQALMDRGAQALILGCTEIPLALQAGDLPVPIIASNQALAEAAVREALG